MVKLSCIIIALNEEKYLSKLLESLKNQSFQDFEIIVADYNSKDKTREIARKYGCKIVDGGRASVARNNGAKKAKGDYLLFLDADGWFPENFLKENLKEFKKSKKGVGTIIVKPLSDKLIDKFLYKLYNFWVIAMLKISPHASGCAIFARKDVFDKVKGFDESIVFAEDHAFARKAKKYGFIMLPIRAYTSTRRLEKEGRLSIARKFIYCGICRLVYKEVDKELFKYDDAR